MGNLCFLIKKCWGVVDRLDGVEDNKLDVNNVNVENVYKGLNLREYIQKRYKINSSRNLSKIYN